MKRKKLSVPKWMRKRHKVLSKQEKQMMKSAEWKSMLVDSVKRVLMEQPGLSQEELDFLLLRTVFKQGKRDKFFLDPNIPRVRNILSRFPKDQHKGIIRLVEGVKWCSEMPLPEARASAAEARKKRIFLLNQMLEIKGKKLYRGK